METSAFQQRPILYRQGRFLIDFRPSTVEPITLIYGALKDVFIYCDSVRGEKAVLRKLESVLPGTCSCGAELSQVMAPLVKRGLMMTDGSRWSNLPIPIGKYSPSLPSWEYFSSTIKSLGTVDEFGNITVPLPEALSLI